MPKDFDPKHPKRKTPYSKQKPKTSQSQEREEKQYPSVNDLKRRIRDVKRLLAKTDLPADKRIIQERALSGYEKELADEERRRERSRMIKKYHFVRFLDRKTATKEVNKLTRKRDELAKPTDESIDEGTRKKKLEKLDARLHIARVNLNYTIYYPLTEKYISIYAEKKKSKGEKGGQDEDGDQDMEEEEEQERQGEDGLSASATAEKLAMWRTVEKCMEGGTLDLLREGQLGLNGEKESAEKNKAESSKKSAGEKKANTKEKADVKASKTKTRQGKSTKHSGPAPADEGDESDGGFFEM
ncbi:Efg1 domain-containing protein [Aspergillus puulaauensis]|uniref:rRNA-processing protein EFG1 n=1 Tax=Aspergillus puulaauensis TaxID=1220207 RepID=A0A7R7XWU0_9EURO|nr:18S rRNA maturation protein [Aspergillus puulaauensis]BCS29167.1 18S rRNA maturation protein [Aspergillus puulaauensis]